MALKVADYSNEDKESMLGSKLYLGHEMMRMKAQSRAFSLGRNVTIDVTQNTLSGTMTQDLLEGDAITSLSKAITLDSGESIIVLEAMVESDNDEIGGDDLVITGVKITPDGEDDPVVSLSAGEPVYSPEWLHGDFEIEVTFEEYTGIAGDGDTATINYDIFTLSAENVQ